MGNLPESQSGSVDAVGSLYSHLGAAIIGGFVSGAVHDSSRPERGDVVNADLSVGLEAKGANNNHGWRLNEKQLDLIRPTAHFVYLLAAFSGRKWVGSKKKNGKVSHYYTYPLNKMSDLRDRFDFLARKTTAVTVIDLEFMKILHLSHVGRHVKDAFGERNNEMYYELQRSDLEFIRRPSRDLFQSLGINSDDWIFQFYEYEKKFGIKDPGYLPGITRHSVSMKFPLYTILSTRVNAVLQGEIFKNNDSDSRCKA